MVPAASAVAVPVVALGEDLGGGSVGLLYAGMAVLALALVGGRTYADRRRQAALRTWASAAGWTYHGVDATLVNRWRGTPFGVGNTRRATEVVSGPVGERHAISFKYQYVTGSGKNRTRHTRHVVAVFLPRLLPVLELTPDGIAAKLVKAFGGQDIRFESEAFNRAWRVSSEDPRFAHDIVTPRTMERLLRPDVAGTCIRFAGDAVLTWSSGRPTLEDIVPRATILDGLVDAVPAYVWEDRGYYAGGR